MKYKTFFTTLVLFLFFINLGITMISMTTFNDTVQRAEEKSLSEHYFITSALLNDFHSVESRGMTIEDDLASLLEPYSYLSGNEKVGLAFYKNKALIYTNGQKIGFLNPLLQLPEDETRLVSKEIKDGQSVVTVSGNLPAPYQQYTMVYLYNMTESMDSWRQMKNRLFIGGLILSIFLALGLLVVLNRLFKPLLQISQTSRHIAAGEYEKRLPITGNDELSEMAKNFNYMAEEIQNQMHQLATSSKQKQQFIDNLAHELRTPLTSIYGYAEYLQRIARTEEDQLLATNFIMDESRRLQNMSSRLLDMAILRESQIEQNKIGIDCLFHKVQQSFAMEASEQKIDFLYDYQFESLDGDTDLLHMLLVNLIDNAMKACSEGGVIKLLACIENGQKVLAVQDNGKGMSEYHLAHITEAFYRVDSSRSRVGGGAGLGLTLCQQIAVHHRAKLHFTSELNKGTTVKLIFT